MKYRKWLAVSTAALMLMTFASPLSSARQLNKAPDAVQSDSRQEQGDKLEQGAVHDKLHKKRMSKEEFEAFRLRKLQEMAQYFGISTDGKSAAQLKQELESAKAANAEKWEAYKAEQKAKRLELLRKDAAEHGIDTKGKSAGQLHEELRKAHGGKRHHPLQENPSLRQDKKE